MQMKKLAFLIFAALLPLLAFSVPVFADSEGIFSYTVENGAATVTAVANLNTMEELVIPDTLGGYPVTGLRENLFAGGFLTNAQLEAGQFTDTHPLKRVFLPDGIKSLPSQLFLVQYSLEEVRLPADLESIGSLAFGYCISLKHVDLPDSVTEIDSGAFGDCWSLESLVLPEGLQSFGAGNTGAALSYVAALRSVYVPAGADSFSYDAAVNDGQTRMLSDIFFGGTRVQWDALTTGRSDLQDVSVHCNFDISPYKTVHMDFSDGLLTLSGGGALRLSGDARLWDVYADETETLILDGGIDALGERTFSEFPALSTVVARTDAMTLDPGAFTDCPALTNVVLPRGGTVAPDAFDGCGAQVNVFVPMGVSAENASWNPVWVSFENGVLTYEGRVTQNAYDFFDILSVFCDHYGEVDALRAEDLAFEGLPLYTVDPETGARTRVEGGLKNAEIYPELPGAEGETRISFNTLCAGVADRSITNFRLVIVDAAHSEPIDTQISVVEQIRTAIKKVLRAIVTLLNKLFRLLKSFGK